jgi:predicted GNAT family acetyltransferase
MDAGIKVRDVPERNRYEAVIDDTVAGFIEYTVANGDRAFTHTEVSDAFEGKGVGSALAKGALEDLRARQLKVRPFCPFVAGWIKRHQDYLELVADGYRDRVTPDGA